MEGPRSGPCSESEAPFAPPGSPEDTRPASRLPAVLSQPQPQSSREATRRHCRVLTSGLLGALCGVVLLPVGVGHIHGILRKVFHGHTWETVAWQDLFRLSLCPISVTVLHGKGPAVASEAKRKSVCVIVKPSPWAPTAPGPPGTTPGCAAAPGSRPQPALQNA